MTKRKKCEEKNMVDFFIQAYFLVKVNQAHVPSQYIFCWIAPKEFFVVLKMKFDSQWSVQASSSFSISPLWK